MTLSKLISKSTFVALLFSLSGVSSELANAAQIKMYENNIFLNEQAVEKVVVRGPEIFIRTGIRACPFYPGYPDKIYGDVYECYTSRQKLSEYLKNTNPLSLPDEELAQSILKSNSTFYCNTKNGPDKIPYYGKNVYWFSGLLFTPSN